MKFSKKEKGKNEISISKNNSYIKAINRVNLNKFN